MDSYKDFYKITFCNSVSWGRYYLDWPPNVKTALKVSNVSYFVETVV